MQSRQKKHRTRSADKPKPRTSCAVSARANISLPNVHTKILFNLSTKLPQHSNLSNKLKLVIIMPSRGNTFSSLTCEFLVGTTDATAATAATSAAGGPTRYLPPHLRNREAKGAGESMRESKRDDSATLRVTNLSEDVTENDIYDLFHRFGQIARVYLARDRETGVCKGFAFVSFADRADAERAQQVVNGYGYDNLILRVEFARSS